MKHKKLFLGIAILCFVIIGIFHFNVNSPYIDTQLSIYVKSLSGEDSLTLDSDSSKTQFYLDISYLTNTDQNYSLYLLDNFEPVSFSLNNGEYQEYYEIDLQASDTPLITEDNLITINVLEYKNNDMCVLLTNEDFVFTKRFQLNYLRGTQNPTYKQLKVYPLDEPLDRTSIMENFLKIDIEYLLSQSHFYNEFINLKSEPIYYAALILENGKISENSTPFVFTTEQTRFAVPVDTNLKEGKNCILIYPF